MTNIHMSCSSACQAMAELEQAQLLLHCQCSRPVVSWPFHFFFGLLALLGAAAPLPPFAPLPLAAALAAAAFNFL